MIPFSFSPCRDHSRLHHLHSSTFIRAGTPAFEPVQTLHHVTPPPSIRSTLARGFPSCTTMLREHPSSTLPVGASSPAACTTTSSSRPLSPSTGIRSSQSVRILLANTVTASFFPRACAHTLALLRPLSPPPHRAALFALPRDSSEPASITTPRPSERHRPHHAERPRLHQQSEHRYAATSSATPPLCLLCHLLPRTSGTLSAAFHDHGPPPLDVHHRLSPTHACNACTHGDRLHANNAVRASQPSSDLFTTATASTTLYRLRQREHATTPPHRRVNANTRDFTQHLFYPHPRQCHRLPPPATSAPIR